MNEDDWLVEESLGNSPWGDPVTMTKLNGEMVEQAKAGTLAARDLDVAMSLSTLVYDEYMERGTSEKQQLDGGEITSAQVALKAVLARLGIDLSLPWRNFDAFERYWKRNGGYGSWQARRDMVDEFFDPVFTALEGALEGGSGGLFQAVSPHAVTGWPRVDMEVAALRDRFASAKFPQDYRDVGNRCVAVLEAVGDVVYDEAQHLREGEQVPARDKTKQRLERYVEDSLAGKENAKIRGVATKVIELAHSIKHQEAPSHRDSGIAADATLMLVNLLRRAEQDL